MGGAAEAMPGLRQVTLGGEYATQADLDLAAKAWPDARVTSIYASTEAGAALAASDGREGFPAVAREREGKGGRRIRLTEEGEMVVTLPGGREVATGDLWEVDGDRLLFRGRNEEIINVGGLKVSPVKVERVLRGVPGVEAVRVVGRASPITGSVVVAEVVGDASQADLRAAATASLARAEQPMKYLFVDAIETSTANKVVRT
jgi:acyl-CoA synthetase (AMP-forming)/AMP-acid ligase II